MKSGPIQIWCTMGPSSLNELVIKRLEDVGVSILRINLSHTKTEDIEKSIVEIIKYTSIPICLDTEGPQIRSGEFQDGNIFLKEKSIATIKKKEILGDSHNFNLWPNSIIEKLKLGDLIAIDFDSALLKVIDVGDDEITVKVVFKGRVANNKAVTVDRHIDLPILSEKDRVGLEVMRKHKLKNLSLSFVNKKEDVFEVRSLVDKDMQIISKIETTQAVENLDSIIKASDAILIDRGDLSREEPINKIPLLQKGIINRANQLSKKVFVATNFLESMVNTKKPLRSEVNDIMNTLLDGADGLILAAETAIGKYPAECANMVKRMIKYYRIAENGYSLEEILKHDSFLLIEPHGGKLVDKYVQDTDHQSINELFKLSLDEIDIIKVEQIGIGTYSPLEGFMGKEELNSVLHHYKNSSGDIWTIPVILQVSKKNYLNLKKDMEIVLIYEKDKRIYGTLKVKELFTINLNEIAKMWFGTDNSSLPGVSHLFGKGEYCIGGEITLIKRKISRYNEYEFTPKQMRIVFEHKEWGKVVGYNSDHSIFCAHEYLQGITMEKYNLDGSLLHSVLGPKNYNDILPEIVLESYKIMMKNYYPQEKTVFGLFGGYPHYSWPREVVFNAICRKNFGCSHFVIENDRNGLKDHYSLDQTRRLFDKLGDIGIQPLFFDTLNYCGKCEQYVEFCSHEERDFKHISDQEVIDILLSGRKPPEWSLRGKVSDMILEKIQRGERIYFNK